MRNLIFVTFFCVLCIIFCSSCTGTGNNNIEILPTDLDSIFVDANSRFSIQPPLDWELSESDDEWSFIPEVAELKSRSAKAKVVIQYIKVDTMHTPEEFRDFIKYEIEQTENISDYKIIEFGGTPSDAYCTLIVNYDSSVGKSTHYFRNILTGMGYFRVSGSALTRHWDSVSPLLKASVASFKLKHQ